MKKTPPSPSHKMFCWMNGSVSRPGSALPAVRAQFFSKRSAAYRCWPRGVQTVCLRWHSSCHLLSHPCGDPCCQFSWQSTLGIATRSALLSFKSPAFSLADSPALCLVPSSSSFSSVRRSWSTPTCRASSSLLCRLLNPRHTHIHSLSHLSIAAQRALSRIVSKLKKPICNLCHSYLDNIMEVGTRHFFQSRPLGVGGKSLATSQS